MVFDRQTLRPIGQLLQQGPGHAVYRVLQNFIFMTTPGCCGRESISIMPSRCSTFSYIARSANTVAVGKASGSNYFNAGSKAGAIGFVMSRRMVRNGSISTLNLRGLPSSSEKDKGYRGPSLWVDQFDNLIFAGSSWGNDSIGPPISLHSLSWNSFQNSIPGPTPVDLRAN